MAVEKLNDNLLKFFADHYKSGTIGLVGTNDAIGWAIREAQSAVTPDKKPSLWSHCFILGELRLDRRGPGKTKTKSPYLLEKFWEYKIEK